MEEEKLMQRCISLARNGLNNASPNPMVGAVVVCDGEIIGEGYHVRCGEAHAEVNAIASVKDSTLLQRSTLYVSLEPCSHYGKTPPCVDLIIEKEIPRIVIGCQDPFAEVAGRGIQKLREAGREVIVGVLEEECRELNRTFITYHALHRPYITLKWAQSADGFIDKNRTDGVAVHLSTSLSSMLVHKRRAEADAILVGTRTARLDNPSLTVRHWSGRNPVRVVLDREGTLPSSLQLFDGAVRTLVCTAQSCADSRTVEYITLDYQVEILPQLLKALYDKKLQSLLVEGGSELLQSFIDANLWDEAFVEMCPMRLAAGVKAPEIRNKIDYSIDELFGARIKHYINNQR